MTPLRETMPPGIELSPELERELDARLAAVRERWPAAPTPDPAFGALVAAQLPAPRIEDLFLAWWCRSGDTAAITAFETEYADELGATAAQFRALQADELRQQLRIKLFVGTPEAPPRIHDYHGNGSLKGWLRVTAVRLFIDVMRSTKHQRAEQELDDLEVLGLTDPQVRQISGELAGAVKAAFATAVAKLEPRQRVFLRHVYVDHHTLEQIAAHYAIHRTTVARSLASAREQLILQTRAALARAVGVASNELTTVIRMLDSRVDLSLSRVLDDD